MPHCVPSQVHIEYQTGSDGALELVRIWASTVRGHWKLVCEMWLQALWSNAIGLRFANRYHSTTLADALSQATRVAGANTFLPNRRNRIQINSSEEDHTDSTDRVIVVTAA
jgi:hypothetical protein